MLAVRPFIALVFASLVLVSAAVAAPTDPQLQVDPTDQAWAETISLNAADMGTMWRFVPPEGSGDPRENTICGSGPDESDLTVTGGHATDFVRMDGGAFIASAVTIWQTAEQAQANWDRTVQPSLLACVTAGLRSASTKKIKLVVTRVRTLAYPTIAARTAAYRWSIAYRTTVKRNGKRRTVSAPATFDLVLLGNGRAAALLATLSFNKMPIGSRTTQAFAAAVAKRMAADPLARG
jgi:hypothetical protein